MLHFIGRCLPWLWGGLLCRGRGRRSCKWRGGGRWLARMELKTAENQNEWNSTTIPTPCWRLTTPGLPWKTTKSKKETKKESHIRRGRYENHLSIYLLYYLVVLLDDVVDIDFVVVFTKNDTNFFVFFLLKFVLWFKSANWLGLQLGGSLNQIWNWIHRFHRNFFYIEGVPLENPFLIGHLLIVLYYNTTYRPPCII